jgi:uncharacterized phage protein (TIGR01671 family)
MRDIIFRGKRVDNGEWVEGFLSKGRLLGYEGNTLQPCIDHEEKGVMLTSVVIPNTVGQFIGQYDKNIKKIYEGDVCQLHHRGDYRTAKVVFNTRTACYEFWANVVVGAYGEKATMQYLIGGCSDIKVIGNIHDNSALLDTPTA